MATVIKQAKVTKEGFEALTKELAELTEVKRPKLVERLSYARQQGDLSENSDYSNAKEELEFLDGRISELEEVLRTAEVQSEKSSNGGVDLGAKVTVKFNGQNHVYHMVGEWEADPVNKKISPESPLGKALLGKKVGESAELDVPAGKVLYEIVAIE